MRCEPRFHFFVITCRDPATDFRRPLVEALSAYGPTTYIWLRRRPVVYDSMSGGTRQEMSIGQFMAMMARRRDDGAIPVYFNSTNTYFPRTTLILRLIAPRGIWCFDVHDDLRYHNKGLKRLTESLIIRLLAATSHEIVHAAPTLQSLFPRSRHLGNASHLQPVLRDAARSDAVLILASFDERLDFPLLETVIGQNPHLTFHLHGWVRSDDGPTSRALHALIGAHPNVVHHGAYATADLPDILARYKVTLAPYKVGTPLTDYVDPLRFYHCLNAGLEVVSTPIPQARTMADSIHVVTDAEACSATIGAILANRAAKQPGYSPVTWRQKARRLVEILHASKRARAFAMGREVKPVETVR